VGAGGGQAAVLQGEGDAGGHGRAQLALGTLDLQGPVPDLDLHVLGHGDDFSADAGHGATSPHVADDLATHAFAGRGLAGHDPARGGEDVDAQSAVHAGDVVLPAVDAATGPADALQIGDHALHAGAVLQVHAEDALLVVLDALEVGDVALVLEDAGDVHLEL